MANASTKLFNATEIAAELGVSPWVIKGLKIAAAESGDSPFFGRYTTLDDVMAWFRKHPGFVASHYIRRAEQPSS